MGARKLSYHVPSKRGYDEKSLKKNTLFSKVDTGIFSVFYPKNRYDYSPLRSVHTEFGMLPCSEYSEFPNRHEASNEYRYGFQGQKLDNEIKGEGNSVNYKYRMHDTRVGRFFAVDPLTASYPHYSPYSFSGNKVIHRIELEGMEDITFTDEAQILGDTYLTLVTKNDVLNDFYQSISMNDKCNIKLSIGVADAKKIGKETKSQVYWGGRTIGDAEIRQYAEYIFRVEETLNNIKGHESNDNSHHFDYFGVDKNSKDPEDKKTIDIINTGKSPDKEDYKKGSKAEINLKAIKDAVFKD